MAIATEITTSLSAILGIPQSTLATLVRRLGESGLIPRGTRGRRPTDIRANDLAHILIAVLNVCDAIEGTSARVVQAVRQIGHLESGGSLQWARGDSAEEFRSATLVVPGGSFLDQITHLIDQCADSNTAPMFEQIVLAVGLSRSEAQTVGWMDVIGEGEVIQGGAVHYTITIGGVRRVFFGDIDPLSLSGMIREARLSTSTLVRLASVAFPGKATSRLAGDIQSEPNRSDNRQAAGDHGAEDE